MKKKQRVNIPEDIKEIRQDSFQDLEDKQGPERWIKINLLQCGAVCVNYFDHSCPVCPQKISIGVILKVGEILF